MTQQSYSRFIPEARIGAFVRVVLPAHMRQHNNNATEMVGMIVRAWNPDMVNLKGITDGPADMWLPSTKLFAEKDDAYAYAEDPAHEVPVAYWPLGG